MVIKTHQRDERFISSGVLEQLTMKELVQLYNSTSPHKHKRKFKSIAEAVTVILDRLVYLDRKSPCERPKGRKHLPINIGTVKGHEEREIGKRLTRFEMTLELIKFGITFKNFCRVMGYSRQQGQKLLYKVKYIYGFGFKEDPETGILRIVQ